MYNCGHMPLIKETFKHFDLSLVINANLSSSVSLKCFFLVAEICYVFYDMYLVLLNRRRQRIMTCLFLEIIICAPVFYVATLSDSIRLECIQNTAAGDMCCMLLRWVTVYALNMVNVYRTLQHATYNKHGDIGAQTEVNQSTTYSN